MLIFLTAAISIFIMDFNFLALTFIIVYIGAIAILFLFVIMLIEVTGESSTPYILIATITILCCLIATTGDVYNYFYSDIVTSLVSITDIEIFGYLLYNKYAIAIVLLSYLLFIVLVGLLSIIH